MDIHNRISNVADAFSRRLHIELNAGLLSRCLVQMQQKNVAKEVCGKMWQDVARCGKMWSDVVRCGEMFVPLHRCIRLGKLKPS
jgi:hypothetical protein